MTNWREKIFDLVETGRESVSSKVYDYLMLLFIVLGIIPLAFREQNSWLDGFDKVAVTAFIVDYLLRWLTADMRMPQRPKWQAFVVYPFTVLALIDLLSILPSFTIVNKSWKLFRVPRLLKILRVFKFIRYSHNINILVKVLHKERHILLTVFWIALLYIVITALIMFNVEESEQFKDFFDALYWATTTLTTVGYGDIYPATDLGRIISMLSAVLGVAVIALPSGVITASYLDELREQKKQNKRN